MSLCPSVIGCFQCMLHSRRAGNFFFQSLILVPLFPGSDIFLFLDLLFFFFFLVNNILEYIPKNEHIVLFELEFVQAKFLNCEHVFILLHICFLLCVYKKS